MPCMFERFYNMESFHFLIIHAWQKTHLLLAEVRSKSLYELPLIIGIPAPENVFKKNPFVRLFHFDIHIC